MEKTKKMIVCETCGGEYDAALVRCPFCGTGRASAEEGEYMEQLEEVRKDLEGHKEYGDRKLKKELASTARIVILVIAVILALVFGGLWLSRNRERDRSDQKKAEFLMNQGISTQEDTTE